jgi:4-hydroxy-3-polyprenylbenzoate decarboxylase
VDVHKKRLIVGLSGASGAVYGLRALEALRELGVETHLVVSKAAEMTLAAETDRTSADLTALAHVRYRIGDVGAPIASGSFQTLGMLIAPCSMKTLAEIAYGTTSNLLTRAADVVLKERRRLVLAPRETPLHLGHLKAMVRATEIGAVVAPPVPAFYARPESVADIVDQTVGRLLDLFDLDWARTRRWGEDLPADARPRGGGADA